MKACVRAVPLIADELPVKVIVPVPGINVPPLLIQLPDSVIDVPVVNVPEVNVRSPVTFRIAGAVKFP